MAKCNEGSGHHHGNPHQPHRVAECVVASKVHVSHPPGQRIQHHHVHCLVTGGRNHRHMWVESHEVRSTQWPYLLMMMLAYGCMEGLARVQRLRPSTSVPKYPNMRVFQRRVRTAPFDPTHRGHWQPGRQTSWHHWSRLTCCGLVSQLRWPCWPTREREWEEREVLMLSNFMCILSSLNHQHTTTSTPPLADHHWHTTTGTPPLVDHH